MYTVFIINEQKQEAEGFIKSADGTIRHFLSEIEVQDCRDNLSYPFKYTGYVFDIKAGEIIDWF